MDQPDPIQPDLPAPNLLRPHTLWDVAYSAHIGVGCADCRRPRQEVDTAALISRLGPNLPFENVIRRLRCKGCGARTRPPVWVQLNPRAASHIPWPGRLTASR